MRRLAVAAGCVLGVTASTWVTSRPWLLAALGVALAILIALLVRAVRRDRGFVAASGYEWHRQTPAHVREPGAMEGVVLPERRIERG